MVHWPEIGHQLPLFQPTSRSDRILSPSGRFFVELHPESRQVFMGMAWNLSYLYRQKKAKKIVTRDPRTNSDFAPETRPFNPKGEDSNHPFSGAMKGAVKFFSTIISKLQYYVWYLAYQPVRQSVTLLTLPQDDQSHNWLKLKMRGPFKNRCQTSSFHSISTSYVRLEGWKWI